MSRPNDRAWSEEEKVFLLTEILRISPIHWSHFFELLEKANVAPRWDDIPLPPGRSLRSCQNAFEQMRQERRHTATGNQQLGAPYLPSFGTSPHFAQQQTLPQLQPSQSVPRKRAFQDVEHTPSSNIRVLQPRPSTSGQASSPFGSFPGAETIATSAQSPSEAGDEPAKKKRGRPTKDEIQRREAEAAARGEVYAPKKRAPKKTVDSPVAGGNIPEASGSVSKTGPGNIQGPVSPVVQQMFTSGGRGGLPSGPSAPERAEIRTPPRPIPTAPSPQLASEPQSFGGYQPQGPGTHFIHRPSAPATSPIPRYQPPLAPANPPTQQTAESSGTGLPPNLSSLYDTQARSGP